MSNTFDTFMKKAEGILSMESVTKGFKKNNSIAIAQSAESFLMSSCSAIYGKGLKIMLRIN